MKKIKAPLIIFFLTFILVSASYSIGLFYGIENFFSDILYDRKLTDERIVVVSIDDESINKIGQWPWKRSIFAKFFEKLNEKPPLSLGLDVLMSENSGYGIKDDESLQNAFQKTNYPIVLPVEALNLEIREKNSYSEKFLRPIFSEILDKIYYGHVNLISDRDGVVRSFPLTIEDNYGEAFDSFARKTLVASGLEIKERFGGDIQKIVFSGPNGTIRRIPFWRIFNGDMDPKALEGKIIFLGATASNLHDEKQTPFDRGTQMSGVEIQAQVANMFLKGYEIIRLSKLSMLLWVAIASILSVIVFFFSSSTSLAIVINLFLGLLHTIFIIYLFGLGYSASLVHITMSWVLATIFSFFYKYMTLDKEKREMRNVFSKYVSGDVLNEILRDPKKIKLGGEDRDVTVFFSDVRGFTTLSEGMTPSQLTNFLNKYLTKMTDIVLKNKGVVDKYIGDAIMSFWGAPVDNRKHALDAIITSLSMVDALADFNKESRNTGDPEIDIGIGLNSGKVTVGNMGSEARFDYTVMGDTVNLASRLEGQTKTYGVKIIISATTKERLSSEDIKEHDIVFREIDRIKVKGKNKPVVIFEVVPNGVKDIVRGILPLFEKVREDYYIGKWKEVVMGAKEIMNIMSDGPTKVLMDRSVYFLEFPPKEWVGVYEMKTK